MNQTMSQIQLAEHFNLDRNTIRTRLKQAGVEPEAGSSARNYKYDFEKARLAIERPKESNLKNEKTEKEIEILDLKIKIQKGEYASVAEYTELTHQLVNWIFTKFDKKFPENVVTKVAKAKNKAEAVAVVRLEVHTIFNELRSNPRKFLNEK